MDQIILAKEPTMPKFQQNRKAGPVKVTVKISAEMHTLLSVAAAVFKKGREEIVVEALRQWIDQNRKPINDQLQAISNTDSGS